MAPRILVVDDEELIVTTVTTIFSVYGYNSDGALSGEEAIAKAMMACPDLLLCDVKLPGMNGFQAALEIKQICPRCHLLFFSAYAGSEYLVADFAKIFAERGYAMEMLSKPVHPAVLLQAVKRSLHPA
jgi:two-component system, response regulator YesN